MFFIYVFLHFLKAVLLLCNKPSTDTHTCVRMRMRNYSIQYATIPVLVTTLACGSEREQRKRDFLLAIAL